MVNSTESISLAGMQRVLKKAGAKRIADSAVAMLRKAMEKKAELIGIRAVRLAEHARRKTVKAEDVRLAVEELC